ncbi:MAG: ABC transporter substrate-binding protein [Synergistaceae bacterium]|nr:ABC transporter substrate-binding protein [Synergistaceae bacterium]
MSKKWIERIIIVLVTAVVTVGLTNWANGRNAGSGSAASGRGVIPADERILVKIPTIQGGGPALIAKVKGYFEEQNLEIEEIGQVPGGNQIQSVITGDIDFTLGNHTDREIEAMAKGIPVKVVLAQSETTEDMPHMRWMVPNDSDIHGPRDLIGKKIAMNYITGGCPVTNLRQYLRGGDVDIKDVQMVQMADGLQAAALNEGLVDVITIHAPVSGVVRSQLGRRPHFSDFDTFQGRAGNNMATSQKIIDNNPEKVRQFVAAIVKAQAWINDNHDEADKIYAEYLKLNPEHVPLFDRTHYSRDGLEYNERVQLWIDELVILGEIEPGQFKAEDIYTNEFNPNYRK